MKSDSVKGRPRVGSWNSPESPSGAANSQIHGEHGSPLADGCCPSLAVPRLSGASGHGSTGGQPICPLHRGPGKAEGAMDTLAWRLTIVHAQEAWVLPHL